MVEGSSAILRVSVVLRHCVNGLCHKQYIHNLFLAEQIQYKLDILSGQVSQINKGNREIKQSVNTKDSAWAQDKNTTLSRVQT